MVFDFNETLQEHFSHVIFSFGTSFMEFGHPESIENGSRTEREAND